jgi:hypothetical protein
MFSGSTIKENKMNRFLSISKPLKWFMAALVVAVAAGCGSSGGGGSTADTTAPTVISTIPVNASTGMAINANITASFSEAMSSATITTTTFTLKQGVTPVIGVVSYAGKVATFNPAANLAASTLYTAAITTGVKDEAGNALAVTKTWTFTTGTIADATAPTVTSTFPADTAVGIALNANTSAAFSESMDASTITSVTFTLQQGMTPVAGVVSYSGSNASFNPTSNLAASTLYSATITTGVMDLAGNALAVAKTWSFTTGATAVAGTAPVLLGTSVNYAILAKTAVSTVPASVITGAVAVSPAAATFLTGFGALPLDITECFSTSPQVTGRLYAADYDTLGCTTPAVLTTAVLDMQTAYTDAASRTATSAATTDVGAGILTGLTLAPGVYEWGSAITIPTDLTLNGTATDVWIFKVAGTVDMAANKSVLLSGGALPENIFWQVSETVTLGAGTHFEGVVLGQTDIVFGNLSSINGRLLAQTAVTLDATTVTQP